MTNSVKRHLASLLPAKKITTLLEIYNTEHIVGEPAETEVQNEYWSLGEDEEFYYKIKSINPPCMFKDVECIAWEDVGGEIHSSKSDSMAIVPGRADKVLFVRCTEEQHMEFVKAAINMGMSVNQWAIKSLKEHMYENGTV